jgi:hypothetical protein
MNEEKVIKVLQQIAEDTKKEAKKFDKAPLNGETIATYFGYHGAAIATLAGVVELLIKKEN